MIHTPLIVIPARMKASRLPGKPLADIAGVPMILHVLHRAAEADLGPVVVATEDEEIRDVVVAAGGHAVMTRNDHVSGTDRVHEAAEQVDPDRRHDVIVNLQGDAPTIEPTSIRAALTALDNGADIGTIAARTRDPAEADDPDVVKAVFEDQGLGPHGGGRAFYFSRTRVPHGDGPIHHHIGLYAFRRSALDRFVAADPGLLERRERLEQLRALAIGLTLAVAVVPDVPVTVDTPADLDLARRLMAEGAANPPPQIGQPS